MLNIFQRKMFSCALPCKNAFLHQMHFCVHFPLENVRFAKIYFCITFCWCVAKMHFCIKCIFAKQNVTNAFDALPKYIWCVAKMHFCIKCIWCVHFVTQNVTNAFDAKMHFCVHFPKENVQLCQNAFDAYILLHKMLQMHLMRTFCYTKCYKCIFATRTFSKGKCSAYIFQRKMFSKTKCYKCIWCQNAFDAYILLHKMLQMHFCNAYIFLWKMFSCAKMHLMRTFCFALRCQNAFVTFCVTKCTHQMHFGTNKMLQMHLMRTFCYTKCYKCIFATHHIFLWKMFSITFFKGKCSAKQNVTNAFDAKMHLMLCKNIFDALQKCICNILCNKMLQMHFCNASHFPKENVQRTFYFVKCSASHFVGAKMHLMRTFCYTKCYKCIWCVHFVTQNVTNAFDAKMHFCNASHFPKENVQRTFYFGKCSASHFPKENVQQNKMLQMRFCNATRTFSKGKCSAVQKCIWCYPRKRQNAFWRTFSKEKCSAYIFQRKMFSCAKMHLMQKCIWCKNAFDAYIL